MLWLGDFSSQRILQVMFRLYARALFKATLQERFSLGLHCLRFAARCTDWPFVAWHGATASAGREISDSSRQLCLLAHGLALFSSWTAPGSANFEMTKLC